jgi:predicted RNA-binding protein with PUA-like domain
MAHWLVQGNPAKWRVHEFFADGNQLDNWSITRYRDQIQEGDDVALWLAGRDAGVVGLGTVTGPVEDVFGGDIDPYWVRREDANAVRMRMPLRLNELFLDDPVTREELRHDLRFAGAAILAQPFAGNPFPLTDDQWAAIVDHRHTSAPTDDEPPIPWMLYPGDRIRRTELHDRYGGSGQSGISPSRATPNILVFADPRSGERHGYFDQWAPDDSFHYTGEGQRGDQTMTKGNLAILNHRADSRALRVFRGATGTVQYVGEFVLDELEPYTVETAPSTGNGPPRRVFRFHLFPIDRAVTVGKRDQVGRPFRRRDEDIDVTSRESVTARDPDAAGRGLRAHNQLQNRLNDLVGAAGYTPIESEPPIDPAFDLAWFMGETLFMVEVKSCTPDNQTHQLRLGIGQVLDYEDTLLARGYTVQPVLYLEQEPADPRWSGLAQRHGIQLIWAGTEHSLLSPQPLHAAAEVGDDR